MEINIGQSTFILDHRKAMFHIESRSLIVADLHVGKSAHFRKHGQSLPAFSFNQDLIRLLAAIDDYKPEKLLILGDLYHSDMNEEFVIWHEAIKTTGIPHLQLIVGNHDLWTLKNNDFLKDFSVSDQFIDQGLLYSHEPTETEAINICGHLHPGIKMYGKAHQRLSLDCFWYNGNRLVLPAFSELTGRFHVTAATEDNVFVCTEDKVILLAG